MEHASSEINSQETGSLETIPKDRELSKPEQRLAELYEEIDVLSTAIESAGDKYDKKGKLIKRKPTAVDARLPEMREIFKDNSRELTELLKGSDTPTAWSIRRKLFVNDPTAVVMSMWGIDSPEADLMRSELEKRDPISALKSSVGVDSSDAWRLRDKFSSSDYGLAKEVIWSARDLESPKAWNMREEEIERGPEYAVDVAFSIGRLDSEEAWDMRQKIVEAYPITVNRIVRSFDELKTPQAVAFKKAHPKDDKAWD